MKVDLPDPAFPVTQNIPLSEVSHILKDVGQVSKAHLYANSSPSWMWFSRCWISGYHKLLIIACVFTSSSPGPCGRAL